MYIPPPNSLFLWTAQPFTFTHDLAHPSVHTALPSLHFCPPNCCMHSLPTATVPMPFHTNCSAAHNTSHFIHFDVILCTGVFTNIATFGMYRCLVWCYEEMSTFTGILIAITDIMCMGRTITYVVILSLHTTTAAEIKKRKCFFITKTVLLSWNYENTDKFTLHHCTRGTQDA
jgi:hypothetical protein